MKSDLVWLGLGGVALYFAYTQGLLAVFNICPAGMSRRDGIPLPTCQTDLTPEQLAALVKKTAPTGGCSVGYETDGPGGRCIPMATGNTQICPSGTVMTSAGCQAPPSFAGIPGFSPGGMGPTGMGRYNYIRRGTPMRYR